MISMKRLPVGYRLNPTDEDLVNHHLKRKLLSIEEEYCLIPEFDIYKLPPWDLITKFNELSDLASDSRECFFYYRRSNPKSKQNNRMTKEPEGFWKPTGKGRNPLETDQIKWSKKYLVFHLGKQKSGTKTDWAMHEYTNTSDQSIVVCRIHKKKRKEKVGSVSSEADSNSSPRTTDCSETPAEPQEISPEASASTKMDPQNLPLSSNFNVPEYSMSSSQQKQLQMLRELLSEYDMQPSSDSSEGGSPYALNFGQFPQTNLEVTRDFATESPTVTQDLDIGSMSDSFFAASPPP